MPECLAMILCDQIVIDHGTGKSSLMGVFGGLVAREFPATHPQIAILVDLTDGHGETPLSLKLVRTTAEEVEGETLQSWDVTVPFADPRVVSCLQFKASNITFPEPGEYRFVLESQGILIIERRFVALSPEQAQ